MEALFWIVVGLIVFVGAFLWYGTLLVVWLTYLLLLLLWEALLGVLELLLLIDLSRLIPPTPGRHRG